MSFLKMRPSQKQSKQKKAQFFSTDSLIAMIVIIVLILIMNGVYSTAVEKTAIHEVRSDLEYIAFNAMASLVDTKGIPENWNRSNVNAIGIQKYGNIVDLQKLQETIEVLEHNSSVALQSLGIKGPTYNFSLTLDAPQGLTFATGFFNSTTNIAYSYGQDSESSYTKANNGIRAYLYEHQVPFRDYEDRFDDLITNITQYDIVIFENPEVDLGHLSPVEETALQNFVLGGGIYVQKGYGDMIELFNTSTSTVSMEWGDVIATSPMIKNIDIGDRIFTEGGMELSNLSQDLTVLVASSSGDALVGHKPYGTGNVFYFSYSLGIVEDGTGEQLYTNLLPIISLPLGKETEIQIGNITNSAEVVKVTRTVGYYDPEYKTMKVHGFISKQCESWNCND